APATEVWTYTFSDRGRGPELTTRLVLGDDGLPVWVETTGHDYLKVPVEERFSRTIATDETDGGRARWKSGSEAGESELTGPAFYLSYDSAVPELALLARALRDDADGRIALLPDGEAVLAGAETLEVAAGEERRRVTRVSIGGFGFQPASVWLDSTEGRDGSFFASVGGWFAMVPEGWEGAIETLQEAEERADQAWAAGLAERLAHRPEGPVALVGAAVFDPRTGEVLPGRTVVVEGERIAAVGPDGEVAVPEGATRIDAAGKTVLPGLWDMHTHLGEVDGVLQLAAGVTSVRDLANDVERVTGFRAAWDSGKALGPRVILGGFLDGPGPFAGPTKALVATPAEAIHWIERYHRLGYEQIKVYSSLDPALLPTIARAARERGMRLSGHVPQGLTAAEAVRLGFHELQHVNFLFLNFWGDEEIDTRTPARFTEVAARAAAVDLGSQEVERFVKLLAKRRIEVDPTLAIFEGMFLSRPGEVSPGYRAVADRLPPQVRRGFLGGGLQPPEGMDGTYRESFRRMVEMVGRLHRAGVPLLAGTDGLAGFTLHRELELYVEAGIPAPEVLRIATLGAAEVTGRADRLGTVEAGKLADLIVVAGNPAEDVSHIRNVELTIKGGTLYRSAELYEAVGIRP
ncbi:MAG TPA: amidohydrolase family protein, partial [Thermoanaerobaculia bacterium]|nr:amidohydrolase family protein [Thermoanaerobaculia bacterium]